MISIIANDMKCETMKVNAQDMYKLYSSIFKVSTNKMTVDFDVLGPFSKLWVRCDFYSTNIIGLSA